MRYREKIQTQHLLRVTPTKIPYYSHSPQKKSAKNIKSFSSKLIKPMFMLSPLNQSPKSANNNNRVVNLKYYSKSPQQKLVSSVHESSGKNLNVDNQYCLNTTRNFDEIKKKIQQSKAPLKVHVNYFPKDKKLHEKLENMKKVQKNQQVSLHMNHMRKQSQSQNKFQLKVVKKLGKTQTGEIILVYSRTNNLLVAVKTFKKSQTKIEFLIDELKIQLYCCHPNILPAYGYHIGKTECYLMMQVGFHNLYDEILKYGPFNEDKTANYTLQILSGLDYLHRNGVMHRDLKPENILCFGEQLKITDFGWSIRSTKMRRTLCGTLEYISPEVANRQQYNNKIDCWSVGVLIYEMLTNNPPFSPEKTSQFRFKQLKFPEQISANCKDLIQKLLEVNPSKRMPIKQAIDHAWIKRAYKLGQIKSNKMKQLEFQVDALFE